MGTPLEPGVPLPDDVVVHRVGGGAVENLRLRPVDAGATPPGLSVLAGGTPEEAVRAMLALYPGRKWRVLSRSVATTTAAAVRAAGFEAIFAPSDRLPNHARITHSDGTPGFSDDRLAALAAAFVTREL